MAIIRKKIWPKYFDLLNQEKKKYEFRLNDFKAKEGDVLVLEEWNPKTNSYTGRTIKKKITHVIDFKINELPWSKKDCEEKGFKLLSLD